ncbi:MAG: hypothetical protein L0215_06065 [Gemmataceae bacterium]|nr:hypothetical protein [Gemmataceae bacterium]
MPALTGEVVYLYAYDVANEVRAGKIHDILSKKPFPFEIQTDRTFPKDVPLYKPLTIEPPLALRLTPSVPGGSGEQVRILVRVYEVGVVALDLRVPFAVEELEDLHSYHDAKLDDGRTLDEAAHALCQQVYQSLLEFLVKSAPPGTPEAYTAFCVTGGDAVRDAEHWLTDKRRSVAGLLSATPPEELSEAQVHEVLRLQCSFTKKDVVVVD